jgi:hypothetical protein
MLGIRDVARLALFFDLAGRPQSVPNQTEAKLGAMLARAAGPWLPQKRPSEVTACRAVERPSGSPCRGLALGSYAQKKESRAWTSAAILRFWVLFARHAKKIGREKGRFRVKSPRQPSEFIIKTSFCSPLACRVCPAHRGLSLVETARGSVHVA